MAVESRSRVPASPQSSTMPTKVTQTIRSCTLIGPSSVSDFRAAAGASGVAVTSGGMSLYNIKGSRTIAVTAGTTAASVHDPNEMVTPAFLAISAPRGLATIDVSHSPDEMLRL